MAEPRDRAPATVDVKFREGVSLDSPLRLLPLELRAQVTRAVPLVTLPASELERVGAARMARWYRLTLAPNADVDAFLDALTRVDSVATAERSPKPALMEP